MNPVLPRIVVAVDFSLASQRALEAARSIAREMGAQLDLVHVCASRDLGCAHARLDRLERTGRAEGLVVNTHVGTGETGFALVEIIRRLHPDLVVLGSHGSGGAFDQTVGSVVACLMRHSARPLLVVPAGESPSQLAIAR